MRMFRHSLTAVLAAFAMTLLPFDPYLKATVDCLSPDGYGPVANSGTVDGNGIRHLTLSMPSTWSTDMKNLAQGAINSWNARSGTTKIQFDTIGDNNSGADVKMHDAPPLTGSSCASAIAETGDMYFSSYVSSHAPGGSYNGVIARDVEHEIGHILGMDHSDDPSSVMSAASYTACSDDVVEHVLPDDPNITDDDATSAGGCVATWTNITDFPAQYDSGIVPGWEEDCSAEYWVSGTEEWTGTYWTLDSLDYDLLWTDCSGPPPF